MKHKTLPILIAVASLAMGCEVMNTIAKEGDEPLSVENDQATPRAGESIATDKKSKVASLVAPKVLQRVREEAGFSPNEVTRERNGMLLYRDPAGLFNAWINPEGKVHFSDPKAQIPTRADDFSLIRFVGPAEGVAQVRGAPHAAEKLAFLRRSERFRANLAVQTQKQNLNAALESLSEHLRAAWHDETRPLERRHETLFLLWDECDEQGDASNSAATFEAARAGEVARRRIEAFIRDVAAAGTAKAISTQELARFNARRRSKRPFNPYTVTSSE